MSALSRVLGGSTRLVGPLVVCGWLAAGCNGGAQTHPNGPGGVAAEDSPAGGVIAEAADDREQYDTSPVPEPGLTVLQARWQSPADTVDTLARFGSFPADMAGQGTGAMIAEVLGEVLRGEADLRAFVEAVDERAPVDLVAVADTSRAGMFPEPMLGFSVGLKSLSRARQALKKRPIKIGEGVWRVGAEDWGGGCALAASSGQTRGRLVCTESFKDLEKLAPYMARNLPIQPAQSSDLHAELRLRGLFDKYGRQWGNQVAGLPIIAEELKMGVARFDNALMDAAAALAAEAGALMKDADTIVLDADVDGAKGLVVTGRIEMAGKRSWTASTLVAGANLAGPAPDMFWRLPASSSSASYGRSDPTRYEPLLKTGGDLLEGFLEKEKFGTGGDRRAIADLLRLPFKKGAATVVARGSFPAGGQATLQDVAKQYVGWTIIGVESGGDELKSWINDAVKTYNRAGIQQALKNELQSDAKHVPQVKTVPAPAQLGPGALAVQLVVADVGDKMASSGSMRQPAAKQDIEAHLLLMNEGGRTWVAFGVEKDALVTLLSNIKSGTDTLAGRPGLERLKRERHLSASVSSLDGLLAASSPALWSVITKPVGGGADPVSEALKALERTPNKGRSPIFLFSDVEDGPRPKASFRAEVPEGTLRDVGSVLAKLVTQLM